MNKLIPPLRASFTTLMFAVFLLPLPRATGEEFDDIGTKQAPPTSKWGGLRWSLAERKTFQGRPQTRTDDDPNAFLTVAYGRYVSYYDLKQRTPRWVAYVTDKASALVTKERSRTGPDFDRPSGGFFTDGVLAEASDALDVPPAEHSDYGDMVPESVPATDAVSKTISVEIGRHPDHELNFAAHAGAGWTFESERLPQN